MLQESLLVDTDLVEFIQVYQEETAQVTLSIALAAEIQAIGIAKTKLGRQQDSAEGGFSEPLRSDKHRCCSISMLFVTSQPMCHHAQEPTVEQIPPMRMTTNHLVGQLTDTVAAIPFTHLIQIFLHRIIHRDGFGIQETVDVPVPCLDALLQRMDGDAVPCALVQRTEAETDAVPFPKLQLVGHRVETDDISAFQEIFQTKRRILFASDGRTATEAFHLGIHVSESGPYSYLILIFIKMFQRTIYRLFFGDARLETLSCQRSKHRCQVIASVPIFNDIQRPFQSRLEHDRQCMIGIVSQVHAGQRVFFHPLLFAERGFIGHRQRLLHTEGRCIGMKIGGFIQRHTEILLQRRFLQRNRERDKGLATLYRHPIGLHMKK